MSGNANAVDIDKGINSVCTIQSRPIVSGPRYYRQEIVGLIFPLLSFHLTRKAMITALSPNRDYSRFVLILISFTTERPKREVALRRAAEINWCCAITLHPLICFGLLQCDRRLALSARRYKIRNTPS